jgi:uncharacterized membrane protein YuzA (DUF378 family)
MKALHSIAFILVIIGGLNWLLVGVFNFNIVDAVGSSVLSTIVYLLVGISALYLIFTHKKTCKQCESSSSGAPAQTM